jgi:hypothetical protein
MKIDILIVVSTPDASSYLEPLLLATLRADCKVAVFLTNDGVKLASATAYADLLNKVETAVVCSDSWANHANGESCTVTLGSQTDHSQLAGCANKIISF